MPFFTHFLFLRFPHAKVRVTTTDGIPAAPSSLLVVSASATEVTVRFTPVADAVESGNNGFSVTAYTVTLTPRFNSYDNGKAVPSSVATPPSSASVLVFPDTHANHAVASGAYGNFSSNFGLNTAAAAAVPSFIEHTIPNLHPSVQYQVRRQIFQLWDVKSSDICWSNNAHPTFNISGCSTFPLLDNCVCDKCCGHFTAFVADTVI